MFFFIKICVLLIICFYKQKYEEKSYEINNYCIYQNRLYRFTSPHTGPFDGTHVIPVSISQELVEVQRGLEGVEGRIGGLVVNMNATGDANDYDKFGFYSGANLKNAPTSHWFQFISYPMNANTDYMHQFGFYTMGGKTNYLMRYKYDGIWQTDWIELNISPKLGSNENGQYCKWGNGLAICWRTFTIPNQTINNPYGPLFLGRFYWNLPITFAESPVCGCPMARWETGGSWATLNSSNTNSATFNIFDVSSRGEGACYISIFAIGRWK